MAENFVLNIATSIDETLSWIVVDDHGAIINDKVEGDLNDAAECFNGQRLIVLCPAANILRVNTSIPIKGDEKIRQALPFALEDKIAGNIDNQHFAFDKTTSNGSIDVAVVKTKLFESWLNRLNEFDLQPDRIYAESDGIASLPSTMSVLIHNKSLIIKDQDDSTTVVDLIAIDSILELLIENKINLIDDDEISAPINIQIFCDQENHLKHEDLWGRLRMRVEDVEIKLINSGSLPRLARQVINTGGVNLLQGEYARKAELIIDWRKWRFAASLFVATLGFALLAQFSEYWSLSKQENQLNLEAEKLLSETFPGLGPVINPWAELRTRLGAIEAMDQANLGFSDILDALAAAYSNSSEIEMETLSYRSGTISLQFRAPDVESLDKLRQNFVTVARGRFSADILSANPINDDIQGRIQIKVMDTR